MTTPDPNDPRQYGSPPGSPYSDPTLPSGSAGAPPPRQPYPDQPAGYAPPGYEYPPPGYGPTAYGSTGYAQPGYPPHGYPAGGYGAYEYDPLVPAPGGGASAWWNQSWRAFARSWKQLLAVVFVTTTIPGIVFTGIEAATLSGHPLFTLVTHVGSEPDTIIMHWRNVLVFSAVALVWGLITVFLTSAGWAAAMWIVTRQAAGRPAPVGAALAYGFRRCPKVGGVLLLVQLMVFAGLIACIVPGLYLAAASSLFVPFLLFERGRGAISGSFQAVNANFGAVLGRLLIVLLITVGASIPVSAITRSVASTSVGAHGTIHTGSLIFQWLTSSVVGIPATMFWIIAVLMTYAQMRARAVPTTVGDLAASLDR